MIVCNILIMSLLKNQDPNPQNFKNCFGRILKLKIKIDKNMIIELSNILVLAKDMKYKLMIILLKS